MRAVAVTIRPLAEEEVELLEGQPELGPSEKHRERILWQQGDRAVYLIAWKGDVPVGHVLLKWDGTDDEPMASRLTDCPDIEDLLVVPEERQKGIGSQFLAAAEELARQRGYSRVGLGVAIDNYPARTLYRQRGYQDSGFGQYPHSILYVDDLGQHRWGTETCVYLIKPLQTGLRDLPG